MEREPFASEPIQIGFLLIDGFALMSYAAAVEPLRAANLLAGRNLYEIRNFSAGGGQALSSSGAVVPAEDPLHAKQGNAVALDFLFVAAGGDPLGFEDTGVFQMLRQAARRGVVLGGISGGPVILAKAGTMGDRRMTVHWEHAAALAEIAPMLLLERSLFVFDRDRITCAGGMAPLDMMHSLIARHQGAAFAQQVSDWFIHTEVRPPGGQQRAGLVERHGTTNPAVIQAIELMENHVSDPLDLAGLARLVSLGKRQLNRLFMEKLGRSTMAFYRDLRLDKARGLLAHSTLSITQIALATGFANSAHFSKAFAERFGQPPSAARH